ncbi:hypothetical protein B4168_3353 [Anoxybacillus flavithermus]|nr:hypothetical protein B4168_3353 [Anoxybacillus flavithermus]OAO85075.1 hypothetical protein GT23_3129 [Parageobacillus thermoglucosidasius]
MTIVRHFFVKQREYFHKLYSIKMHIAAKAIKKLKKLKGWK